MKNEWWSYGPAASYVTANYPCGFGGPDAAVVIENAIEDGLLTTRSNIRGYDETGILVFGDEYITIPTDEWHRSERDRLRWKIPGIGSESVEYRAAEVRRLCSSELPARANLGGAPAKYDYEGGLIHLAERVFNDAAFSNPTEEQLAEAMREWFAEHYENGGPDAREIRKRARRFYHEVIRE